MTWNSATVCSFQFIVIPVKFGQTKVIERQRKKGFIYPSASELSYSMQLSIYCDSSQVWSNKSNREAAEEGIHISFRWEQLLVTISLDKREQSMNSRRINSEPRERLMKYLILIVIFLINDLVLHIGT